VLVRCCAKQQAVKCYIKQLYRRTSKIDMSVLDQQCIGTHGMSTLAQCCVNIVKKLPVITRFRLRYLTSPNCLISSASPGCFLPGLISSSSLHYNTLHLRIHWSNNSSITAWTVCGAPYETGPCVKVPPPYDYAPTPGSSTRWYHYA